MRSNKRLGRFLFFVAVKSPIAALVLILSIGGFIYYGLFVYQVDKERSAVGTIAQDQSGDYVLQMKVAGSPINEEPSGVYWYSGNEKRAAHYLRKDTIDNSTVIWALVRSDEWVPSQGESIGNDRVIEGSVVFGKERVIDKIVGE